ncbi:MAG: hypothetical protein HY738_13195 [Bacteroidia bacterium]|nr:hypothetical protein [Bacteroidia bacterium]
MIFAYTSTSGFPDNNVHCIIEDDSCYLWMTSNKGIYAIKRFELNDVAEGKKSSFTTLFFGKGDGIKNTEFNGGFQPSAMKASDGCLWFPTIKGVVVVDQ